MKSGVRKQLLKKDERQKAKAELLKEQESMKAYQDRLNRIRTGHSYIQNKVKAALYMARCNMLARNIEVLEKKLPDEMLECVDNVPKTLEYLRAEYAQFKVSAVSVARQAHFDKEDLKKLGCSDEDIRAIEDEYLLKPITREEYDENYRRERMDAI